METYLITTYVGVALVILLGFLFVVIRQMGEKGVLYMAFPYMSAAVFLLAVTAAVMKVTINETERGEIFPKCGIDTEGDNVFNTHIPEPFISQIGDDGFLYDGCIKTEDKGDRLWANKPNGGWGYCNQTCPTARYKYKVGKNDAFGSTWAFPIPESSQFYKYDQQAQYYESGVVNQGNVAVSDTENYLANKQFTADENDIAILDICKNFCSIDASCNSFRTLNGRCYFNETTREDDVDTAQTNYFSFWKLDV